MNGPQQPKSRWPMFLLGAFGGGLIGLMVGAGAVGLFAWAYWEVSNEYALDPLIDLEIPNARLTAAEAKAYIDRLAQEYLDSGPNAGLVIGYVADGQRHTFGYGTRRRGASERPDGDTLFELASVGKTFTATVLADMHLRKELDWNTPLVHFLPKQAEAPRPATRAITLLDLATHTSGLPSLPENFTAKDPLNPYADYTVEEMYRGLAAAEVSSPPGRSYAYSNFGFGLLGHVLELKAGVPYEDLIVGRLCAPLGMQSTRMTLDDALKSRLAVPHDGGQAVPVWEDRTMAGAGSFLSTANDLLKYIAAHFGAAPEHLAQAMKETTRKRRPTDTPATAMGLGWHINSENALDIVWHNGGSGGSRSYAAFVPDARIGVVVLSNSSEPVDALGHKVLYLLHRYAPEPVAN